MASSIQLGSRLTMSCERRREGCIAALTGEVDEKFDSQKFTTAIGGGAVVIDLDKVGRITSYGVREWLRALRDLDADYYCFARCRPSMVSQFNMVSGFACNGELVSLYAPFLCPSCNTEIEVLIDLRRQHAEIARFETPSVKCETCGSEAEFDDMPESYFSYVSRAPCPNPPAHVLSLLDPRPVQGALPFKVDKEVSGTVTALSLSGTIDKRTSLKRLADGLEGVVLILLGGVKEISGDGLARFAAFTRGTATMYLGNVGTALLDAIAHDEKLVLPSVLSLLLPMACPSCGLAFEGVLDRGGAQRAFAGGEPFQGRPCPSCQKTALASVTPAQARAALGLQWADPPVDVAAYLHDRERIEAGHHDESAPASEVSGIGNVTFGKYKLIRRLGSGGMAEIFLARQRGPQGFEKKVALKRVLPSLCEDEEFVTMFLEEARLAARLSHPNIVQVLDLGRAGDQYFIALEYVRGADLRSILRVCGAIGTKMPIELACRIVADACTALSAAHTHKDDSGQPSPIVHRDVSPQNILVSTEGVVKLADFGVAKAADSVHDTEAGSVKGKPSYMSPERILGTCGPLDPRPDVFAAGVVLYECLTNERPYTGPNNAAIVQAVLTETPRPASACRADLPTELDAIVMRAVTGAEGTRYQDARSLQIDLEKYLLSTGTTVTSFHLAEWLHGHIAGRAPASSSALPSSFTPTGDSVSVTKTAPPKERS